MDCQLHFQTDVHVCEIWCVIVCPEQEADWCHARFLRIAVEEDYEEARRGVPVPRVPRTARKLQVSETRQIRKCRYAKANVQNMQVSETHQIQKCLYAKDPGLPSGRRTSAADPGWVFRDAVFQDVGFETKS